VILGGGIGGAVARQGVAAGLPAVFLHFTRQDEAEADYLGVQYLYAAGYDPNGAISIFEKLESMQKTKPSAVARVLASHPVDSERIDKAEKEIQRILPDKPEYVVTTSEYREVRERLLALEARRQTDDKDGRPALRVKPSDGKSDDPAADDNRPTIKRRDLMD
jgi:predicted Zn-dependent protease